MPHFPARLAVVAASAAMAVFGAAPAFAADTAPLPPTSVTATFVAADVEVDVAWIDASTDETSFVIERCQGVGCASFTVLTTWPAIAGTGSNPWYADCTGLECPRFGGQLSAGLSGPAERLSGHATEAEVSEAVPAGVSS